MLGPNIPISLNSLLFFLFLINIYYLVTVLFTHLLLHLIFSFYKLEIIQCKYKTMSLWNGDGRVMIGDATSRRR